MKFRPYIDLIKVVGYLNPLIYTREYMIKKLLFTTLIFSISICTHSQGFEFVSSLSNTINETSGLIHLDNRLFTHNDSGDDPHLYELSEYTGEVLRTVTISGAEHMDWEDICSDDTYVYIADMGNNSGNRVDLVIYKLLITDLLNYNSVSVEEIHFSYSDQVNFESSQFSTEFDAEAIVAMNDKLYIFTKNWTSNTTNIYELPKSPGTYSISKVGDINSGGLITGGTYNSYNNTILLVGYQNFFIILAPFIIELSGISEDSFNNMLVTRSSVNVPDGYSTQVESVVHVDGGEYYLSAEDSRWGNSGLFSYRNSVATNSELVANKVEVQLPTLNFPSITIAYSQATTSRIYNLNGSLLIQTEKQQINTADLEKGIYVLRICGLSNNIIHTEKFVVR